ncbi:MAG: transglutaminase-like domain-containing protein [Chitinophagaceae bacterium]|nr:transglutaminase-like domain-containing protein [Chitinophagaceae bacterium]
MEETSEINALLNLIEDPDHEVFDTISNRIVSYGRPIIPNLEQLWESTPDKTIQQKIDLLIHRLRFHELQSRFSVYATSSQPELLEGALLVARYQYPEMAEISVLQEIEKIKRNIWLELNSYLTSLEQVNIFNRIFFSYYKFKGVEVSYQHPDEFLINRVLETRCGNAIINGILYQLLCGLLDIPVKAIKIPRQYLLAYFDNSYDYFNPKKENKDNIHFYIDPMNGHVYTHKDVESYFNKTGIPLIPSYFKPLDQKMILHFLLEELAKCFDTEDKLHKQTELLILADLLSHDNPAL